MQGTAVCCLPGKAVDVDGSDGSTFADSRHVSHHSWSQDEAEILLPGPLDHCNNNFQNLATRQYCDGVTIGHFSQQTNGMENVVSSTQPPSRGCSEPGPSEMIPEPGNIQGKKKRPASRKRGPNFTVEEKLVFLAAKLEWNGSRDSKAMSEHLLKEYGYDRCPTSWQQQWDTLVKQYKVINAYEVEIPSCDSFWKLNEDQRKERKLPTTLCKACYLLVEKILQERNHDSSRKETRGPSGEVLSPVTVCQVQASTITDSEANFSAGPSDAYMLPTSSQAINMQVCMEPPRPATLQPSDINDPVINNLASSTQGSLQPEGEFINPDMPVDHRNLRTLTQYEMDNVIAPFVKEQIDAALKPYISASQSRKEDKKKFQEKMLDIEEKKLALLKQEMQLTDRAFKANSTGNYNTADNSYGGQALRGDTTTALDYEEHVDNSYLFPAQFSDEGFMNLNEWNENLEFNGDSTGV